MFKHQDLVLKMLSSTKNNDLLWNQIDSLDNISLILKEDAFKYYSIKYLHQGNKIQEWNLYSGNIYHLKNKNFDFYLFKIDLILKFFNFEYDLYEYYDKNCVFLYSIDKNNMSKYLIGTDNDDPNISDLFINAWETSIKSNPPDFSKLEW
ncbi:protein of unknown function [Acetoanaerobium sticklandii]|uniref:Uncharacterized protein n=1 Tax=Acetoanaerobium sticklandii (strain ATCC 12662 / DSM 519 / JCM 1433 / CCUG 9281 / NCIMB 10654 / HF) TaxID=499177 RepID=E3PS32_ACESD|nr:hypothetical protein [Acetoanaerobium sticklandii]CBH21686.1 protein of unknown function [Acetoanaerobium sticklandii]